MLNRRLLLANSSNVWSPEYIESTYTRLTFIECAGAQYIDLDYIMQEDDVIEMDYVFTKKDATAKCLFGTTDGTTRTWIYFYNNIGYISYGSTADVQKSTFSESCNIVFSKTSAIVNGVTTSISNFSAMPNNTMYLFAYKKADGTADSFGYCRCSKFVIKRNGETIKCLLPYKRNEDGVVGMLDITNGDFYENCGSSVGFVAGSEIKIHEDYELIDYVTFAKDKVYDLGVISDTNTLEVLFQRSESSSTPYLYGLITSPHTASVTAYLSSGGAWRFGSSYKSISYNNTIAHRVVVKSGNINYDLTSGTFTKSTFTTPNTVPLGGSRSASGTITKSYQGKVYYFRISDSNGYVLDLVPCRIITSGMEGFWDCVNNRFIAPNIMV